MFFNEAIEEVIVHSIISFIVNTSIMCRDLQSSGSNYVSLTDNKVCGVSSKSAHPLSYPPLEQGINMARVRGSIPTGTTQAKNVCAHGIVRRFG